MAPLRIFRFVWLWRRHTNQSFSWWITAKMVPDRDLIEKSSWTVPSPSPDWHGWMIDRWNLKRHLKDRAASSNRYPSPSLLAPRHHLTPAAPPLHPSSPSTLSPYVYESVTMATSPQGQRRRGLLSFRQISIAGLIYDGLFRDYNTDERSKHVHLHTCLDITACLYPWAHS